MLSAAAAHAPSCTLGDCRGWFRNISLISYPAKWDFGFWRLRIAASYAQPLLSFTACWMSHVFHNDPQCPSELNLPSLTSGSWYCENPSLGARSHPKILGASRSWRSLISTCALLVQLLEDIPAPDTQPWWYLAKQLLFARSCSFLWSQCNYKWMQQRREVEHDWSRKILYKYTPVIRCHNGFGLFSGQRRCVYICCNVSF